MFLDNIQNNPPQPEEFVKIVNNLVVHVQSGNIRMQTMSVHWLRAFVEISGKLKVCGKNYCIIIFWTICILDQMKVNILPILRSFCYLILKLLVHFNQL